MTMKYISILSGLAVILVTAGCSKDEQVFEEPYQEGREPLGIKIDPAQVPVPASGNPGAEVTVKGTGMLKYKEDLVFMFNGEQAEITEVTDSEIRARVPDYASTGVTSVAVGDIVVFGPEFTVTGRIRIDPTFRPIAGTNELVDQVLKMPDGKLFLVGDFTNYDNKGVVRPINRIVRAFPDGTYDPSFRSGRGA
ncbi:MAG TPA: DUF5008 domain-containing protein, partial [Anseongella sp.]|nr:DUF5008 domain-containing protein [Anseongella sp.]